MPSHKRLKGLARDLVESFDSSMNYVKNDYVVGHIILATLRTGAVELRANLLTGQMEPSPLLVQPVIDSIQQLVRRFPDQVKRCNSSMDFVRSAELIVTIDPAKKRPVLSYPNITESPFTCTVNIADERGILYSYTRKVRWYPKVIL